jgi:hypothetical protein
MIKTKMLEPYKHVDFESLTPPLNRAAPGVPLTLLRSPTKANDRAGFYFKREVVNRRQPTSFHDIEVLTLPSDTAPLPRSGILRAWNERP